MIEDIKKEISNLTTFNGGHNRMYISDLFKMLDKYKEKEDKYKTMWEELQEKLSHYFGLEFADTDVQSYMQELSKKYNLDKE